MNETDMMDETDNQEITISRDIGTLSFSRDQFETEDGEEDTHFQVGLHKGSFVYSGQMNNCMISSTGALLLGQTSDMLMLGSGMLVAATFISSLKKATSEEKSTRLLA